MSDDLKPCPWCGRVPPKDDLRSYYNECGGKWGGVRCCADGPTVRTGYEAWPAWKDEAIKAWNDRKPQGKE